MSRRIARDQQTCLSFDGINDVITFGTSVWDQIDYNVPFTISAWIRPGTYNQFDIISKRRHNTTFQGWGFYMRANGELTFYLNNITGFLFTYVSNSLRLGTWQHALVTYDGSSLASGVKFYVNAIDISAGKTVVSDTLSGSVLNSWQSCIGARNNTDSFLKGQVSSIQIFLAELTPSQISELSFSNSSPAGLTPYIELFLDEGSGTTITDTGTAATNGTISGATWSETGPYALKSTTSSRLTAGTRLAAGTRQVLS